MSPVAHAGLGLLGWELSSAKKNGRTLFLFLLIANFADVDFLFFIVFGSRPLFIHQYYTHNLLFVLGTSALAALALPKGRGRLALVFVGLSHLAADLIVIDPVHPVGIRLFFPFSDHPYNFGFFPYLQRWPAGAVFSLKNLAVVALEAAIFVVPVVILFRKKFKSYFRKRAFWLS